MNQRLHNIFLLALSVIALSCTENPIFLDYPQDYSVPPLRKAALKYSKLFYMKYRTSGNMVAKINDSIYFYGSFAEVLKYNLSNNEWYFHSYSDIEGLKRGNQGTLIPKGDSILVFASPQSSSYPQYYNFISLNTQTLVPQILPNILPFNQPNYYESGVVYNNKAIILLNTTRQMYELDINTLQGKFLNYPFEDFRYNSPEIFVGRFNNYMYLYSVGLNQFMRINLDDYSQEKIELPDYVAHRLSFGSRFGMVGNLFCFWPTGIDYTFCYDVNSGEWLDGGGNYFLNDDINNWGYCYENNVFYYFSDYAVAVSLN